MTFFSCPFSSDLQKLAGRKGSLVNTEGLKGKLFNNSSKTQAIFDIWVNVHYAPCAFQMCAVPPRYKNRHPFTRALDAPDIAHRAHITASLTSSLTAAQRQEMLIVGGRGWAAGILQNHSTK